MWEQSGLEQVVHYWHLPPLSNTCSVVLCCCVCALQQLASLQNPCSFAAGPVLMAAQTTDVLRHLSSVELAKNAAGVQTDRLAALASHVVGQRR
jgi:hypothetical protein